SGWPATGAGRGRWWGKGLRSCSFLLLPALWRRWGSKRVKGVMPGLLTPTTGALVSQTIDQVIDTDLIGLSCKRLGIFRRIRLFPAFAIVDVVRDHDNPTAVRVTHAAPVRRGAIVAFVGHAAEHVV